MITWRASAALAPITQQRPRDRSSTRSTLRPPPRAPAGAPRFRAAAPALPDEEGVDRRAAGGEEPIPFAAAEGQVGDDLREVDLPDQLAIWRIAVHAVAGARPDVALGIHPEAVRHAGDDLGEDAAVGQAGALHHIEGDDVVRAARAVADPVSATYRLRSSGRRPTCWACPSCPGCRPSGWRSRRSGRASWPCRAGPYVITGDAVSCYENLEGDPAKKLKYLPIGLFTDLLAAWNSMARIEAKAQAAGTGSCPPATSGSSSIAPIRRPPKGAGLAAAGRPRERRGPRKAR